MQTPALIFLSSTVIDGPSDVADQSNTPYLDGETLCCADLTIRRRKDAYAILFSPDSSLNADAALRNTYIHQH
jgi:hypothetical protein